MKGKGKQSDKTNSPDMGGRYMFGMARNSQNTTKHRLMMSNASQALELATDRNPKALSVDTSFGTNPDRKRWLRMLTSTSQTFPKGGLLTWQALALKGESDKDVVAVAKIIVKYTQAALKAVRKQARLDPDDRDEAYNARHGEMRGITR